MPVTQYWREKHLKATIMGSSITAPGTVFLGLASDDPSSAGTANELSGNGYARVSKVVGTANWVGPTDSGADEVVGNKTDIVHGPASGGNWVQATNWVMWDSASGGNALWYGQLVPAVTVLNGATYTWKGHATDPTQSGLQLTER